MNEEPTLADWKATAEASMWFPYRRALTRFFANFIQSCVPEFALQRLRSDSERQGINDRLFND